MGSPQGPLPHPGLRTLCGPNAATSAPSALWLSSCAPKASRTTATWEGSLSPAVRGRGRSRARGWVQAAQGKLRKGGGSSTHVRLLVVGKLDRLPSILQASAPCI